MNDNDVLALGTRKALLFDDALVAQKAGFALELQPAERVGGPVLRPDQPWEVGGICGDSNVSVVEDGGRYMMWYVLAVGPPESGTPPVLTPSEAEGMDPKVLADIRDRTRFALCYATSDDGVHWDKPQLDLVTYGGSSRNNMVMMGRMGGTVFKDERAEPDEQLKLITGGGPRLPHDQPADGLPTKDIYHAIYGGASADGIHWRMSAEPIVPWYTDTTNVAYWDDRIGKYVAFVRWNEGMVYRDGRTISLKSGRFGYRAIGRTESEDFWHFPAPVKVLEPTPEELADPDARVEYYNTAAAKYPFADDSYFLFISDFYWPEPDTLDVTLATSRDGIHYTRVPGTFLGLGKSGEFDSKCIYMATGMVRHGDDLFMYYAGYDHRHGDFYTRGPASGAIGRVRVGLDRFVAQQADAADGQLVTVSLTFQGRRLEVNADVGAGGFLKAELLDASGAPIPGHTQDEADALDGDGVVMTLTWDGRDDVSALRDTPVQIRFVGRHVKLYALQFTD